MVDPLLASGNPSVPVARRHLGDSLDHRLTVRWNNFVSTTDSRCLIACGYPDYSFRVIDTDSGRDLRRKFVLHFPLSTTDISPSLFIVNNGYCTVQLECDKLCTAMAMW